MSANPTPGEAQTATLIKLRRIYGGHSLQADAFGRRPALPSEIQRAVGRRAKETGDR
ncbi:MAG: hypothetical protein NZ528_01430 [Caldilineales bacterium]|nr:hypothetical protein [Caldilineales bacterium]MDW8319450.1 hypothetical protein [Anaerolineae bacterium]